MLRKILPLAALLAIMLPAAAALANPAPWTDKNNVDATICSTYKQDGTKQVVRPTPGVDTSCPGAPTATIGSPSNGSSYSVGDVAAAQFSCQDSGYGVATCLAVQCAWVNGDAVLSTCQDIANGGNLDTSTAGAYVFSVRATDSRGYPSVTSVWFTVTNPGSHDSDNDGVVDASDLCPNTTAGATVDSNGCSASQRDSDHDGVSDAVDTCPNTSLGETVDQNGCSASQRDSDSDGVSDAVDTCPNTPAGEAVDQNGCSASQRDSDSDGVSDALDKCPNTPAGATVNLDGCSAAQLGGDGSSAGIDQGGSNTNTGSDTGSNSNSNTGSTNTSTTSTSTTDLSGTAGDQLVLGARLAGCNVVLKVSHKQRSFRRKGLALTIRADRACTVQLSGKLIPAKRAGARKAKVNTKAVTMKLKAGKTTQVKLRFTKKGLNYLKRSLKGKITRARIFVSDGANVGHKLNRSFTIRIKG